MEDLTNLMNRYGSDKGTIFGEGHGFSDFYNSYFVKYKNPKILEIGLYNCKDVYAINEFYDGKCEIYGIDIDDTRCAPKMAVSPNYHYTHLDQSNRDELVSFTNSDICKDGFDIIIDDGSHLWYHQMLTLAYMSKLVRKGGIYILEDLHTSLPNYGASFTDRTATHTPLECVLYRLKYNNLSDDENKMWLDKLKTVDIITNKNRIGNMSVSSVITFSE